MSKYQELLQNPPRLTVKKEAREVIIKTVSCMCDNVHYLKLKKNSEGDFKPSEVKQIFTPALLSIAALLGASSQCFSSVRDTNLARKGSLKS